MVSGTRALLDLYVIQVEGEQGSGPEGDKALKMWQGGGRTYVQTEGQIPLVFYRTSYPSGPLPRNDG